jgi:hypothetical protein
MPERPSLQRFAPFLAGGGRAESGPGGAWILTIPPIAAGYADAQLDDYSGLARRKFPWAPPLRLALRARASPPAPAGTLGFGFWNDPFTLSLGQGGAGRRLPASPQAVWFFYGSIPNDLSFSPGTPGDGWKAASLSGPRVPTAALLPGAGAAILLSRAPRLGGVVVRMAKKLVRAAESPLPVSLGSWHDYALEWHPCEARFEVDGAAVLITKVVPRPPLGFVAWIDNQYATASTTRGFRFGFLLTPGPQTLEIADLRIERL